MTESEYAAVVRMMREQRTQTQEEVYARGSEHDHDDFTPAERFAQYGA